MEHQSAGTRRTLADRLVDPSSPDRRPRRAAYILPALFTAGNLFLGYLAIIKAIQGALWASAGELGPNPSFELAAKAIGLAVFLDGLDGRIARMTRTVSDFGRELDSLADVITFGIAPAVLAACWGLLFINHDASPVLRDHLFRAGLFICFLYLLCGAARLARFNITTNPQPKNPGRPGKKYFVGLPIPAAAAMVAAVVYVTEAQPLAEWYWGVAWLALMGLLSFLMVSTWRYYSFKDINLLRPRKTLTVVLLGSWIFLMWNWTPQVLLAMAVTYVGSGIVIRIGGLLRRSAHEAEAPEKQAG